MSKAGGAHHFVGVGHSVMTSHGRLGDRGLDGIELARVVRQPRRAVEPQAALCEPRRPRSVAQPPMRAMPIEVGGPVGSCDPAQSVDRLRRDFETALMTNDADGAMRCVTDLQKVAHQGPYSLDVLLSYRLTKGIHTLHAATMAGMLCVVRAIIHSGVPVDISERDATFAHVCEAVLTNEAEPQGNDFTALAVAVFRGDLTIARLLLEWGADPARVFASGISPLKLARNRGDVPMEELLRTYTL